MKNEKRVTEALEKLISAAEKDAKVTDSLRRVACRVAAMVEERVPAEIWLPWDYEVVDVAIEGGFRSKFLVKHHERGGEFFVDSNDKGNPLWIPAQTKEGVLEFAQDLAGGWLDELAEFLEKRAQKAQAALSIVNDTSF